MEQHGGDRRRRRPSSRSCGTRRTGRSSSPTATLVRTLLEHGLVDEVRLMVFPTILGRGKRAFPEDRPPQARARGGGQVGPDGVRLQVYRRRLRRGSAEQALCRRAHPATRPVPLGPNGAAARRLRRSAAQAPRAPACGARGSPTRKPSAPASTYSRRRSASHSGGPASAWRPPRQSSRGSSAKYAAIRRTTRPSGRRSRNWRPAMRARSA